MQVCWSKRQAIIEKEKITDHKWEDAVVLLAVAPVCWLWVLVLQGKQNEEVWREKEKEKRRFAGEILRSGDER